jgi:hypothetical protein
MTEDNNLKRRNQARNQTQGAVDVSSRDADKHKAEEESKAETVSKPGGFKNDPDDPTNPNEVRERSLKKLRR